MNLLNLSSKTSFQQVSYSLSKTTNIHKAPHDKNNLYLVTSLSLFNDPRLSVKCKYLLQDILTNRSDFTINVPALIRKHKGTLGRDLVRKLVREAMKFGYLVREEYTVKNFRRYKYSLFEISKIPYEQEVIRSPKNTKDSFKTETNEKVENSPHNDVSPMTDLRGPDRKRSKLVLKENKEVIITSEQQEKKIEEEELTSVSNNNFSSKVKEEEATKEEKPKLIEKPVIVKKEKAVVSYKPKPKPVILPCLEKCTDLKEWQKIHLSCFQSGLVEKAVRYAYEPKVIYDEEKDGRFKMMVTFLKNPERYEKYMQKLEKSEDRLIDRFENGKRYNGYTFYRNKTGIEFIHPNGVHPYPIKFDKKNFDYEFENLVRNHKIPIPEKK